MGMGYHADDSPNGQLLRSCKTKDGSFAVGQGYGFHTKFAQPAVFQLIRPHAVNIRCFAIISRINGNTINDEADVAMMVLLHNRKNGAVAGLQTPVGRTAVKSAGIAMGAVLTDYGSIFRSVVQQRRNCF